MQRLTPRIIDIEEIDYILFQGQYKIDFTVSMSLLRMTPRDVNDNEEIDSMVSTKHGVWSVFVRVDISINEIHKPRTLFEVFYKKIWNFFTTKIVD
jgi:hypothetical protein